MITKVIFAVHFKRFWPFCEPLFNKLKNSDSGLIPEVWLVRSMHSIPYSGLVANESQVEIEQSIDPNSLDNWAIKRNLPFKSFTQDLFDKTMLSNKSIILFRQTQWDASFPVSLREYNNDRVLHVHIPYGDSVTKEKLGLRQPYLANCKKLFLTSNFHLKEYSEHLSFDEEVLLVSGSPRLQKIYQESKTYQFDNEAFCGNKEVLWMPHHSVGSKWLRFGTFHLIYRQMLKMARELNQVHFRLRSHHLLFEILLAEEIMTRHAIDTFLYDWNSLPNTSFDFEDDYEKSFFSSSVLITDGLSSLIEYQATLKPIIFIRRSDSAGLSSLGRLAAESTYEVETTIETQDLINRIYELVFDSKDPLFSRREQFVKQLRIDRFDAVEIIQEELLQLAKINTKYSSS